MYTEEKSKKGGLLKEFVLKLILIIIFVLLLLWIIPWSKMDTSPLKDQIFNQNIQTMKEAGISYFTTERLPKEVGDKTTLTLQKMLDLKLLIPFTDKYGKSCDVKESYVTLEKQETEYLMKVNLKCSKEEDYILVHLGCYSYCSSAICEAKKGSTEKQTAKPTTKPTQTTTPTVKPTTKPTTTPTVKPTTKPTTTPVAQKMYEYKKTVETKTDATYSKWSNWTEYVKKTNDGVVYEKTDVKEVEDLGTRRVKVATKAATYVTVKETHTQPAQVGNYTYRLCTEYKYFADQENVYKILTDWTWATGADAYKEGYDAPEDTIVGNTQIHYELVGINFDKCGADCTNHPYLVYRKQTRQVERSTNLSNITAECTNIEEKSIPLYINRKVSSIKTIEKTPAQDIYANVRYYRVRTRELLNPGTVTTTSDIKWSTYNDLTLLNNGYHYTGNYK